MTVGRRRGSFPSTRRSGGRTAVLVIVTVVMAIVIAEVAADVVNSGRVWARVEATTYVAEVIPVIDDSTMLAATMHSVRASVASLDRTGLERALGDLVSGTSQNAAQLGELGVAAPSARSGRLLEAALDARALGSRDLAGAVDLGDWTCFSHLRCEGCNSRRQGRQGSHGRRHGLPRFCELVAAGERSGRLPSSRWVNDPASWEAP